MVVLRVDEELAAWQSARPVGGHRSSHHGHARCHFVRILLVRSDDSADATDEIVSQ
jgi:hypothetical protein